MQMALNASKNQHEHLSEWFQKTLKSLTKYKKEVAAAILVTLWIWYWIHKYNNKESKQDFTIETPSELQGKNLWDLYSYYLWQKWVSFKVEDSIYFNPDKIIDDLYDRKFRRKNVKGLRVAKEFYEENVESIDFNEVEPITLDEYIESIQAVIDEVDNNFDRDSFNEKHLNWNEEKIHIFKNLRENIDAKSLVAYSMAELFPGSNWDLNRDFFSFLLEHAGEKFLYYLPAVNDDLTSFGPYQFTYYALADFWDTQNGASKLNKYFPDDQQLPWSVVQLRGKDHHKAAYLFALYNISKLVKSTEVNRKAIKMLWEKKYKSDLGQLIAIMHNKPAKGHAFVNERYRLRNNNAYDKNKNNKVDLYESIPSEKCASWYGKKTYYNRKSL